MSTEEILKKLNVSVVMGGQKIEPNVEPVISNDVPDEEKRNDIERILCSTPPVDMVIHISRLDNELLYDTGIDIDKAEEEMDMIHDSRYTMEIGEGVYVHYYSKELSEKKYESMCTYILPVLESCKSISDDGAYITTFDRNMHFHCVKLSKDEYKVVTYITFIDETKNSYYKNVMKHIAKHMEQMNSSTVIHNPSMISCDQYIADEQCMYTCIYSFNYKYNPIKTD